MEYIYTSFIFLALFFISYFSLKKFINSSGNKTGRYPVIGYKRIVRFKLLPSLIPVVEKDNKQHALDIFNIATLIPIGSKIKCHEQNGQLKFKQYSLLNVPIATLGIIFITISIFFSKILIPYLFFGMLLSIFVFVTIDEFQIKEKLSLEKIFKPFWKIDKFPKLTEEEYLKILEEDKLLNYKQAVQLQEKESRFDYVITIFLFIIWFSYVFLGHHI